MGTTDGLPGLIFGVLGASIPGIVVALLTYWLSLRRENARARRARQNALALLALEIQFNQDALKAFWDEINGLDPDAATRGDDANRVEGHLAAMAEHGWLGYTLPAVSAVRWDHFPADALGALSPKQAVEIASLYRDLHAVSHLYTAMMAIPNEEREELDGQRFWYNHFAGYRVERFQRLAPVVRRALDARPFGDQTA